MPMADSSPSDRGGDEADQKRDQDKHGLGRTRINRERLQGHDSQQEDDGQSGQENIQRDLVRCFLPLGAFDQGNHAVQEGFPGVRGDADFDPVGEHSGAAGHRRPVAARFPDDGGGLAGDGRLIDRGHAIDDFAIGGNELAGRSQHQIARAQLGAGHSFDLLSLEQTIGHGLRARLAKSIGLGFPPAFRHGFGKIRKQHGKPEPQRDLQIESQNPPPAG